MGSRQHKNLGDENLIYLSFFLSVESAAVRINGLCVTYCHERFPKTGVTARGSRRVRIINEFGLLKGSQFIKCTERSLPKFDLAEPRYFKLRSGFIIINRGKCFSILQGHPSELLNKISLEISKDENTR